MSWNTSHQRNTYIWCILTIIIEDLHNEYEVIEKFRGSTTNNGSDFREISGNRNWMKKMIWFISKSEGLLALDLTITLTICILLFHFIVDALAIFKVWSQKLMLWKFKILAFIIYATLHWQNFSSCGISNHQVLWIQTSLWNILDNYWFLKYWSIRCITRTGKHCAWISPSNNFSIKRKTQAASEQPVYQILSSINYWAFVMPYTKGYLTFTCFLELEFI